MDQPFYDPCGFCQAPRALVRLSSECAILMVGVCVPLFPPVVLEVGRQGAEGKEHGSSAPECPGGQDQKGGTER